jgi:hypothetical protein
VTLINLEKGEKLAGLSRIAETENDGVEGEVVDENGGEDTAEDQN